MFRLKRAEQVAEADRGANQARLAAVEDNHKVLSSAFVQ